MSITVCNPVQEAVVDAVASAPRLESLDGRVLGLYSNEKLNATALLERIGARLADQFELAGVVHGTYPVSRAMQPGEWRDTEQCDAIVLAIGDCGPASPRSWYRRRRSPGSARPCGSSGACPSSSGPSCPTRSGVPPTRSSRTGPIRR